MRHLIITRGPNNSGRQAYIQKQDLLPWLVDQHALETLFYEPVSDPDGGSREDPQQHQRIRNRTLHLLEEKMARGALVVFNPSDTGVPFARQTPSASDRVIAAAIELARKYRYTVHIVDFSRTLHAEGLCARRKEAGTDCTPAEAHRILSHMKRRIGLTKNSDVIWHDPDDTKILDVIEPETTDLSQWRNIVAIGDIHGCSRTLARLTDNFEVRDDTYYIFLGDYINKGPDSGGVLRALLDHFMPHSNCSFLTGNHERPLSDWAAGSDHLKYVFTDTALPTFKSSAITRQQARTFLERTVDAARFHWRGLDILATHGGFALPPERLAAFSAEHYQFGTDASRFDPDQAWEANIHAGRVAGPETLIQLHGHRNPSQRPIAAALGSYCLEDGIDKGGDLCALALSRDADSYVARGVRIPNMDIPQKAEPARNQETFPAG
jgi:predicted kinase